MLKVTSSENVTHQYQATDVAAPEPNGLTELQERLVFETDNLFFSCSKHKFTYQQAIENDFKCSNCNLPLNPYDNQATILAIKAEIERII